MYNDNAAKFLAELKAGQLSPESKAWQDDQIYQGSEDWWYALSGGGYLSPFDIYTKEEAEKIYNSYMEGLIGVQKYQKFCRMDVMEKGYILLNPKTKYKAFIYDYPRLKKYWESFQENGF